MPVAETCTPSDQLEGMPCMSCLSNKELLAALVLILAVYNGHDPSTDISEIAEDGACFRCLSDKQKFQHFIYSLGNSLLGDTYDMNDIRDDIKCLLCYGDGDLKAMATQQVCEALLAYARAA